MFVSGVPGQINWDSVLNISNLTHQPVDFLGVGLITFDLVPGNRVRGEERNHWDSFSEWELSSRGRTFEDGIQAKS